MALFQLLTHVATPVSGSQQIPCYSGGPEDLYITPDDIATMPIRVNTLLSSVVAYTPVLADAFKVIETTSTNSFVFTIPSDAQVAYPVGTLLQVEQIGTGRVSYTNTIGVTVRWQKAADGVTDCKLSRAINSPAAFRKRGANDWHSAGDLSST